MKNVHNHLEVMPAPGDYRDDAMLTTVATSPEAHQAGLDRIAQAGGQPTSVVQVGCELQRDWARQETAEGFTQILFGGERPLAGASTEPAGNGARAGRTASAGGVRDE